jgi:Mg2+-importing ATPase
MAGSSSTRAAAAPGTGLQRRSSVLRWIPWLLGAALFVTVIFVVLHFSEGREFAEMLQRAKPRWLLVACLLQAATYWAQGEVFRVAPCAAGFALSRLWLFKLSFAKLFMDQALPSGGVTSTALVSTAIEQQGVTRRAAVSGAIINMVSYYAGYVVALAFALVFLGVFGRGVSLIIVLAVLFLAFSAGLTTALLLLSGRPALAQKFARVPLVKQILNFLEDADPAMIRSVKLQALAIAWQLAIFLFDAATLWVLLRAVGAAAPAEGVFASFMVSSLFRTMGFLPGGLGTYEAASVTTLRMIGTSFPVALSVTLLFRGITFWLPMLPGLWYSHRVTRPGVALASHP